MKMKNIESEVIRIGKNIEGVDNLVITFYKFLLWIASKGLHLLFIPMFILRAFQRRSQKCPPINNDLLLLPASKLAHLIRNKQVTSETVIKTYISRIQQVNPIVNAVVEERFTDAIEEAKKVDALIASNKLDVEELAEVYPLLGVPLTVKGSIAVEGMGLNAGLWGRNRVAKQDATVVKYVRTSGAIPLLTSNTPELCLNWETINKVTGITKNPYNSRRTSGGSSGGEAALLGAGASLLGLGSDIAGSLRLPAHFCGVCGHKPTPGAVSFTGHYPNCSNLDDWRQVFTVGPLTRYVTDLRLLLAIISEPHARDVLRLQEKVDVNNINVFYMDKINSFCVRRLNRNVQKAFNDTIYYLKKVSKNSCPKVDLRLMHYADILSLLRLVLIDEVENLYNDRGDGAFAELLKYLTGTSKHEFTTIVYGLRHIVVRMISPRCRHIIFTQLNQLKEDLQSLLGSNGVLVLPTYVSEAHYHRDVYKKLNCCAYMAIFNVLGFPVTNSPVAYTPQGLPIGVQIAAAPHCDRLTLAVAEELEKAFGGWQPPTLN